MKRKIIGAIMICTAFSMSAMPVLASETDDYGIPMAIAADPNADAYTLTVNNAAVELGNNEIYVTESGALMLPVRVAAEALGYTVSWDGAVQGINIDNGTLNSTFCIGENLYATAASNAVGMSAPTSLESAPELVNSTTYIPSSFFELLYYTVEVENNNINISTEESDNNVEVPNPFVGYKSIEEAKAAVKFNAAVPTQLPTGYEQGSISVMSGEMLEVEYVGKDSTIIFRTAQGENDISGDYNEYPKTSTLKSGDNEISVKGDGQLINNAMWTDKGKVYTICADKGISETELLTMVESVK